MCTTCQKTTCMHQQNRHLAVQVLASTCSGSCYKEPAKLVHALCKTATSRMRPCTCRRACQPRIRSAEEHQLSAVQADL